MNYEKIDKMIEKLKEENKDLKTKLDYYKSFFEKIKNIYDELYKLNIDLEYKLNEIIEIVDDEDYNIWDKIIPSKYKKVIREWNGW